MSPGAPRRRCIPGSFISSQFHIDRDSKRSEAAEQEQNQQDHHNRAHESVAKHVRILQGPSFQEEQSTSLIAGSSNLGIKKIDEIKININIIPFGVMAKL